MAEIADVKRLPQYIDVKQVQEYLAPLPRKELNDWAVKGWVRAIKLGSSQQSRKIFRTEDILNSLHRLQGGYMPRIKNRKR